jgi:hypothetical protein
MVGIRLSLSSLFDTENPPDILRCLERASEPVLAGNKDIAELRGMLLTFLSDLIDQLGGGALLCPSADLHRATVTSETNTQTCIHTHTHRERERERETDRVRDITRQQNKTRTGKKDGKRIEKERCVEDIGKHNHVCVYLVFRMQSCFSSGR